MDDPSLPKIFKLIQSTTLLDVPLSAACVEPISLLIPSVKQTYRNLTRVTVLVVEKISEKKIRENERTKQKMEEEQEE